jgi:hypothetical protein
MQSACESIWTVLLYIVLLVSLPESLTNSNAMLNKIHDKASSCLRPSDIPDGSDILFFTLTLHFKCSKVVLMSPINYWVILNSFIASINFYMFMVSQEALKSMKRWNMLTQYSNILFTFRVCLTDCIWLLIRLLRSHNDSNLVSSPHTIVTVHVGYWRIFYIPHLTVSYPCNCWTAIDFLSYK